MKKSYYAILTAEVRYDKNLTPNAKLLYAEITALSNETGECWATNSYFSELYSVSNTSISKWISQLVELGYISSRMVYKDGTKEILYRYLRIVKGGIEEKLNTPIEEKLKDNTILINTKDNISPSVSEETKNTDIKIIDYKESPSSPLEEKIIKQFHSLFCKLRTKPNEKFNHKVLLKAKISSWKEDLDKIMRIDKRSKEDLLTIYNFLKSGDDRFWANTIYSLGGIRDSFDTIQDSISREKVKKANASKNKKEEENPSVFKGNINKIYKK